MEINSKSYQTVWLENGLVHMIDQTLLPFEFRIVVAKDYHECCIAIKNMTVRGAGAIGATAAFAMAMAFMYAPRHRFLNYVTRAKAEIEATRPTARNLFNSVEKVWEAGINAVTDISCTVLNTALKLVNEDLSASLKIGEYGETLIKDGFSIATHCNAGWLAFVDYGTALAPIYLAHQKAKKIFVYADETRPRGQGARLTAWELKNAGIPHCIIPDNAGAYLMSKARIDIMIVGADRIARNGDVANKIGTLEKAIIAKEYGVPFYVAAPSSTFDMNCYSGNDIIIEERSQDECIYQEGKSDDGSVRKIMVSSPGSDFLNIAFDVTPAKYITGIITENGIIKPSEL